MYGATESMICVLFEDDNGVSQLCRDFCGGVNDLEGIELMVVDSGDINLSLMCVYDACVGAKDSSVGSPVDEGSSFVASHFVVRNIVYFVVVALLGRWTCLWYRWHNWCSQVACPVWCFNSLFVVGLQVSIS